MTLTLKKATLLSEKKETNCSQEYAILGEKLLLVVLKIKTSQSNNPRKARKEQLQIWHIVLFAKHNKTFAPSIKNDFLHHHLKKYDLKLKQKNPTKKYSFT
jgi:hypothetical protein